MDGNIWTVSAKNPAIFGRVGAEMDRELFQWSNGLGRAGFMIKSGHVGMGFKVLDACLDKFKRLLDDQSPRLLFHMVVAVITIDMHSPELAQKLAEFFGGFSATVFPPGHPITVFWSHWHRFKKLNCHEFLARMQRPYLDFLRRTIGPYNHHFIHNYRSYINMQMCIPGVDVTSLELDLQQEIENFNAVMDYSHGGVVYLRLQHASLLIDRGELKEVENILAEAERWLLNYPHADNFEEINLAWHCRRFHYSLRCDLSKSLEVIEYWYNDMKKRYGPMSGTKMTACHDLRGLWLGAKQFGTGQTATVAKRIDIIAFELAKILQDD